MARLLYCCVGVPLGTNDLPDLFARAHAELRLRILDDGGFKIQMQHPVERREW